MNSRGLGLLIVVAVQSHVLAGETQDRSEALATLLAIPDQYEDAARSVRGVLKTIPDDAATLTDLQFASVTAAGILRDQHSVPDLLRFAAVEYRAPPIGRTVRPAVVAGTPDRLDGYPAAAALKRIGYSSALAICGRINASGGDVKSDRLAVYAEILRGVLGDHAASFMEEEKARAPKKVLPVYDRLMAMPILKRPEVIFRVRDH